MDWEHVVTGRVSTVSRDIGKSITPIRPKHVSQFQKIFRPLWLVNVPFGTVQVLFELTLYYFRSFVTFEQFFRDFIFAQHHTITFHTIMHY
ncbi:hypothetical protein HanXRQr2_Chr14g0639451 [Helianthus annuus]|uniref:Uncharacterized protein n=1 Tax=Helianthus annuus TaxID=4232 RepID=A0A9K3E8P8_HELAN|nr:hypothetical protein HanXRQr2_Chr14g0639451 [Helianthus annuus]KAJ0839975.1 hypothetical protein HanPSC8_Chr14g0613221 [Helianthus annuus]